MSKTIITAVLFSSFLLSSSLISKPEKKRELTKKLVVSKSMYEMRKKNRRATQIELLRREDPDATRCMPLKKEHIVSILVGLGGLGIAIAKWIFELM